MGAAGWWHDGWGWGTAATWWTLAAGAGTLWAARKLWRPLLAHLATEDKALGPFLCLSKTVHGPYSNLPSELKALAALCAHIGLVHRSQQHRCQQLAILHDNPALVDPRACRASVAFIFQSEPARMAKRAKLLSLLSCVRTGELQVTHFPETRCLCVQAPHTGQTSLLVAALRAYPLLARTLKKQPAEVQQQVHGSLELYLPAEQRVVYAYPLAKREALLVPCKDGEGLQG